MDTTLEEILAFVQVVDSGNFTAAANALGVSKASVSRRVTLLEQKLGVRLLERTTRTSRLTELGSAYYERVSRALAEIDDAARTVHQLQAVPKGHLRITASADWGPTFAAMLTGFTRRHAGVTVGAELTQRTVDLVAEGFDLAIRAGSLPDSSLIARRIGVNRTQLYASPRYLQEHGTPRHPSDLADHECILLQTRTGREQWDLTGPNGKRAYEVRGALSGNDFVFVRDAALAHAGIARLPHITCLDAMRDRQLVRVLPDYEAGNYPVHVVYPSARFISAKVRVFCEYFAEWWSQLPDG